MAKAIGFLGLGRLGLPLAEHLLAGGYEVCTSRRGSSAALVELGAVIPDDGSPRAIAEAAGIVCTCLPDGPALRKVLEGDDGMLAADPAPLVIDMTTAPPSEKVAFREQLVKRGGDLLDCPVSGTPEMARAKLAVIYSSGAPAAHERIAEVLTTMAPGSVYVGELGAGTKFKYVANLLAFVHVTAAAEAMAFAETLGLDLERVSEVITASPGATSGQFAVRSKLMAAGKFDGTLVTVENTCEVLDQIAAAAAEINMSLPLLSIVEDLYDSFAAEGEGESDPAKLMLRLKPDG